MKHRQPCQPCQQNLLSQPSKHVQSYSTKKTIENLNLYSPSIWIPVYVYMYVYIYICTDCTVQYIIIYHIVYLWGLLVPKCRFSFGRGAMRWESRAQPWAAPLTSDQRSKHDLTSGSSDEPWFHHDLQWLQHLLSQMYTQNADVIFFPIKIMSTELVFKNNTIARCKHKSF